jgi:hypothetical protein
MTLLPTSPQMPQSRPSSSYSTPPEGKKQPRKRDFFYKHGHKIHPYDGKAPYPLSYDRAVIELCVQIHSPIIFSELDFLHSESLDTRLCQYLRNSVSFVDFEDPPARLLDLGCGVSSLPTFLSTSSHLSEWLLGH